MPITVCSNFPGPARGANASLALLAVALALPLGGCSFDLGSWGSDKERPQPAATKPAETTSAQNVSEAQGFAARGQTLARSGKGDEALAEFERALALDPYNVQALYGRGLILRVEAARAGGVTTRPAACRPSASTPCWHARTATLPSTSPGRRHPISTRRCRPTRAARKPGRPAASPMNGSATRPRRRLPMAARSHCVPRMKPYGAVSRAPAAKLLVLLWKRRGDRLRRRPASSAPPWRSRARRLGRLGTRSSGRERISAGGIGRCGSIVPALAAWAGAAARQAQRWRRTMIGGGSGRSAGEGGRRGTSSLGRTHRCFRPDAANCRPCRAAARSQRAPDRWHRGAHPAPPHSRSALQGSARKRPERGRLRTERAAPAMAAPP